jgi:pimeloyl-ACP methyl ester carboxylesterase
VVAARSDVQALVVRGIYTTQAEYCARVTSTNAGARCSANPSWPARREPIRVATSVKTPVLLVVGEEDRLTPPAMARAVHDSLAGPKELWIAPQAGHTGFESPEYVHQRPFAVKLHGFFKLHLGTAGR